MEGERQTDRERGTGMDREGEIGEEEAFAIKYEAAV